MRDQLAQALQDPDDPFKAVASTVATGLSRFLQPVAPEFASSAAGLEGGEGIAGIDATRHPRGTPRGVQWLKTHQKIIKVLQKYRGGPLTRNKLAKLAGVDLKTLHNHNWLRLIKEENERRAALKDPLPPIEIWTHSAIRRQFDEWIDQALDGHPGGDMTMDWLANRSDVSRTSLERNHNWHEAVERNNRRRVEQGRPPIQPRASSRPTSSSIAPSRSPAKKPQTKSASGGPREMGLTQAEAGSVLGAKLVLYGTDKPVARVLKRNRPGAGSEYTAVDARTLRGDERGKSRMRLLQEVLALSNADPPKVLISEPKQDENGEWVVTVDPVISAGLEGEGEDVPVGDLFKKGDVLVNKATGKRQYEVMQNQENAIAPVLVKPLIEPFRAGAFPAAQMRLQFRRIRADAPDVHITPPAAGLEQGGEPSGEEGEPVEKHKWLEWRPGDIFINPIRDGGRYRLVSSEPHDDGVHLFLKPLPATAGDTPLVEFSLHDLYREARRIPAEAGLESHSTAGPEGEHGVAPSPEGLQRLKAFLAREGVKGIHFDTGDQTAEFDGKTAFNLVKGNDEALSAWMRVVSSASVSGAFDLEIVNYEGLPGRYYILMKPNPPASPSSAPLAGGSKLQKPRKPLAAKSKTDRLESASGPETQAGIREISATGDAEGRTRRRARRPKAEDGRREYPQAAGPVAGESTEEGEAEAEREASDTEDETVPLEEAADPFHQALGALRRLKEELNKRGRRGKLERKEVSLLNKAEQEEESLEALNALLLDGLRRSAGDPDFERNEELSQRLDAYARGAAEWAEHRMAWLSKSGLEEEPALSFKPQAPSQVLGPQPTAHSLRPDPVHAERAGAFNRIAQIREEIGRFDRDFPDGIQFDSARVATTGVLVDLTGGAAEAFASLYLRLPLGARVLVDSEVSGKVLGLTNKLPDRDIQFFFQEETESYAEALQRAIGSIPGGDVQIFSTRSSEAVLEAAGPYQDQVLVIESMDLRVLLTNLGAVEDEALEEFLRLLHELSSGESLVEFL